MSHTSNTPVRPVLLLTALIAAELVSAFESGMIWAAVRVLQELLGDSVRVGWVISAYYLVAAGAAVVGARLGDLMGRTRVLIIVLLMAGSGSLICALFPEDFTMLLLGRCIQGVSAAILPLCYGLVREHMPADKVMASVGLLAGTIGVASGGGLLIGGITIDYYEWHWIFYISAIAAALAVLCVGLWVPVSRPARNGSTVDYLGGILFPPGVGLMLFSITQARYWGWEDGRALGLLTVGSAMIAYWFRHEYRRPHPLINVRLLANRQVALCLVCMILACAAFQTTLVISMLVQSPTFTGLGLGRGASLVGGMSFAAQIVGMLGGLWAAHMITRSSARNTIVAGASVLAGTWLVMTVTFASGYSALWLVTVCFLSYGLGSTAIFAVVPMALIEVVPQERTSEATGMASVVRQLFMGIFTQVVAGLMTVATIADPLRPDRVYPAPAAFTFTALFIATSSVLIIVVAQWLPRRAPAEIVQRPGS